MAWWLVTQRPDSKAPYLIRCRDQEDAEDREAQADREGLATEVYHTATDDIFEAKRFLRKRIANDFGYETASRNFGSEEE